MVSEHHSSVDAIDFTLRERADAHAALGDAHRLAVVDALITSDRSPAELATKLGIGSNLLAHHLSVLQHARLIETVRSSGDRRRKYVRLVRGGLSLLAAPGAVVAPRSIAFVCSANSARSPIAAALWRRASSVPVASAGTRPAPEYSAGARAAARRHGLTLGREGPRSMAELGRPDLIVTVCDEAHEQLPRMDGVEVLHWSVPDPVAVGTDRAFDEAVETLRWRVSDLRALVESSSG